ncbi:hypothetical protein KCH_45840 [Kitasatospora cheerisanensis KCTC 2395]|uniref:Uncharacterized protein n=1 Tax=Kitasatospora cheerisanensis KCTC 2395 TaxID=1348663 RepID=A0A066Z178_9ACTN|nr:hypothetical protein KCH_45840 [Kitasatospora cheerisanensis KCTC 2395]
MGCGAVTGARRPGPLAFAQPLGGLRGPDPVELDLVALAFEPAQVPDVQGEQDAGHGGHPEEGEAGHGGDDRAEREGDEEQGDHAAAPGEQSGPPLGGAPSVLLAVVPVAFAAGPHPVLLGRGRFGRRFGGRFGGRFGPGGRLGGRTGLGPGLRGGGGGLAPVPRGGPGGDVRGVGCGPVRVSGGVLLFGGLFAEGSGRAPFHGRSSGQQADRGTEAFRRTRLVELVLPAEPHRHQIGGPGPYDDRVDKAATAHVSHGTGAG